MNGIIITAIEPQKRKKNRFNLYCENGFFLSLSDETIYRHKLKAGMEIDAALHEMLVEEDVYKYAKELAASYLSYAPRTEKQLLDYLKRKGIDEKTGKKAAALMEKYGYIDDEAYAKELVATYQSRLGPAALRSKLLEKGVSRELAEQYSQVPEDTRREAAAALAEKLRQKYAGLPLEKRRQRLYAALMRRGYAYGDIAHLLDLDEDGGF